MCNKESNLISIDAYTAYVIDTLLSIFKHQH